MKKLTMGILAFAGIVALNSCASKVSAPSAATSNTEKPVKAVDNGLDLSLMDLSVRPQDDFYNYVNGGWMKTVEIPSDKTSWGSFNILRENVDDASLEILNKVLSEKFAPNSEGQKIQALYGTFIDWKKRDADGINPVKPLIAKIDGLKSVADLQKYLIDATKTGDNPLYNWMAFADMKNSNMNAVYFGGPRLGLGKDYYQKENEANSKTLAAYTDYVASLFTVLGDASAKQTATKVVDFEKQLAKTVLTVEQGRDANLRYNPKTVAELSTLVKHVDLPNYLKSCGVATDKVIVTEINYYKNMDQWMNERNLPLIKDYLKFQDRKSVV